MLLCRHWPGMLGHVARKRAAALNTSQLRSISVSANAQALPAPQQTEQPGGWLQKLFGSPKRLSVPLTEPLPGVQHPSPATFPSSPPSTNTTKLSNGLVVAAEETPVSVECAGYVY